MSIFAIGDVHGCLNSLKTLFSSGIIERADTIIFLGDYVDRGPDSRGVIQFLIEMSASHHCLFIRGNHDIMMLESRYSREIFKHWLNNGGKETLASYRIIDFVNWDLQIDSIHWTFLENTRAYHQIGEFIFVHAGLESGISLINQSPEHLFWKKYLVPEPFAPDKKVICGHTSRKNGQIADFGHTLCIDTYAYGGKWLTCLNVETNQFMKANEQKILQTGQLKSAAY